MSNLASLRVLPPLATASEISSSRAPWIAFASEASRANRAVRDSRSTAAGSSPLLSESGGAHEVMALFARDLVITEADERKIGEKVSELVRTEFGVYQDKVIATADPENEEPAELENRGEFPIA